MLVPFGLGVLFGGAAMSFFSSNSTSTKESAPTLASCYPMLQDVWALSKRYALAQALLGKAQDDIAADLVAIENKIKAGTMTLVQYREIVAKVETEAKKRAAASSADQVNAALDVATKQAQGAMEQSR